MIKHLTPRSEKELYMIELKKRRSSFIKKIVLALFSSPLALFCLALSLVIASISTPILIIILIIVWARSFDDDYNRGYEDYITEMWRIPRQPFFGIYM
jgi:hypothetical protein